jgi:putative sterol carrier protein
MTKSEMAAKLGAAQAWVPGKRIKFDFGPEGVVMLDGVAGAVSEDEGAADTVIALSWQDLEAFKRRELDPMTAMMQGRLKVSGDMMVAMQLPSVMAKLQA